MLGRAIGCKHKTVEDKVFMISYQLRHRIYLFVIAVISGCSWLAIKTRDWETVVREIKTLQEEKRWSWWSLQWDVVGVCEFRPYESRWWLWWCVVNRKGYSTVCQLVCLRLRHWHRHHTPPLLPLPFNRHCCRRRRQLSQLVANTTVYVCPALGTCLSKKYLLGKNPQPKFINFLRIWQAFTLCVVHIREQADERITKWMKKRMREPWSRWL